MSAETTYPHGYGTERLTLGELKARHDSRMHPEFSRRFWPWLESKAGVIGIGSGWRTKPHPVSRASQLGRSFHQFQTFPEGEFYTAFDLVQTNPSGEKHITVQWDQVPVQGSVYAREWGLHMNVPGESWHIQPIEIDGWLNWHRAGQPGLFANYPIPADTTPPPPPPPGLPPFRPESGEFSLWPLNKNKPRLAVKDFVIERRSRGFDNWTDRGEAVRYLQGVILHKAGGRISVDGYFGPITEGRVMDLQRWWNHHSEFDLDVDGLVGPNTWNIVDWLAGL